MILCIFLLAFANFSLPFDETRLIWKDSIGFYQNSLAKQCYYVFSDKQSPAAQKNIISRIVRKKTLGALKTRYFIEYNVGNVFVRSQTTQKQARDEFKRAKAQFEGSSEI